MKNRTKKKSITNFYLVVDLDLTFLQSEFDLKSLESIELYSDPKNISLRERVYTFNLIDGSDVEGTGDRLKVWGVYRPYVFEFLKFAKKYFKGIYVWSAGTHKYVHCIVEKLFHDFGVIPIDVLTRDHCTYTPKDDDGHSHLYKPLQKIFEINPDATIENTFALDDLSQNFIENPHNGILIPPYQSQKQTEKNLKLKHLKSNDIKDFIKSEDLCLYQFMNWLMKEKVIKSKDIRKLKKTKIFVKNEEVSDVKNQIENIIEKLETLDV